VKRKLMIQASNEQFYGEFPLTRSGYRRARAKARELGWQLDNVVWAYTGRGSRQAAYECSFRIPSRGGRRCQATNLGRKLDR